MEPKGPFALLPIEPFVLLVASGNKILTTEGISYKEKLWIVPEWLDYEEDQVQVPKRMIRFDNLKHQALDPNSGSLHYYAVNAPIPKDVLDGISSEGFEILQGDQITFGIHYEKHHDH